jgi:signal peptidase II
MFFLKALRQSGFITVRIKDGQSLKRLELSVNKNINQKILMGLILSLSIALDQTTKRIAEHLLDNSQIHSFFFDTIRFQFIKNPGAFLGFGANFSESIKFFLFILLPILFLVGALLFLWFARSLKLSQQIMIALMVGGGLGNMIDRTIFGGLVTDFINMGIGPVRTGIFNIADMILMAGAIGMLILGFLENHDEKKVKE